MHWSCIPSSHFLFFSFFPHFLYFFLFLFLSFQGCICGIWKFPGWGSNPSYSCQPMPQPQQCSIQATSATYTTAHGNAGSLTHWARPGIAPTISRFLVGLFLLRHSRNSPFSHFLPFSLFLVCSNLAISLPLHSALDQSPRNPPRPGPPPWAVMFYFIANERAPRWPCPWACGIVFSPSTQSALFPRTWPSHKRGFVSGTELCRQKILCPATAAGENVYGQSLTKRSCTTVAVRRAMRNS